MSVAVSTITLKDADYLSTFRFSPTLLPNVFSNTYFPFNVLFNVFILGISYKLHSIK